MLHCKVSQNIYFLTQFLRVSDLNAGLLAGFGSGTHMVADATVISRLKWCFQAYSHGWWQASVCHRPKILTGVWLEASVPSHEDFAQDCLKHSSYLLPERDSKNEWACVRWESLSLLVNVGNDKLSPQLYATSHTKQLWYNLDVDIKMWILDSGNHSEPLWSLLSMFYFFLCLLLRNTKLSSAIFHRKSFIVW